MARTDEKMAYLDRVSLESPEYAEVLSFFRELFAAIAGREGETGILFSRASLLSAGERVGFGFPLISPEGLAVDKDSLLPFLDTLLEVMMRAGREGQDELTLLKQALRDESFDHAALLRGCMARERKVIDEAAAAFSVSAALLEFLMETALTTALERYAEAVEPHEVEGWQEGFCPVCGSRAGMAELVGEEGRRFLCCSACRYTWSFKRLKCPYCGNEEPSSLSYFEAGNGPTRVDVCRECSRYLKTRDSRKGHDRVPLDAEDLATIHLDLIAAREGFERGK